VFHISIWGAWSIVCGAKPTKAPPRGDGTGLRWTWTNSKYVCVSLIFMCWLNRTHFWNLLSVLFSTLRPSEMLLLSINCLIPIFASTFYK